jgi:hypothetical protein
MNFKKIEILSIYAIWDRLSLKTISHYCPFKFPEERSRIRSWIQIRSRIRIRTKMSQIPNRYCILAWYLLVSKNEMLTKRLRQTYKEKFSSIAIVQWQLVLFKCEKK